MVHKLTISSVLLGITFALTTLTSSILARDSIHQLPSTNEMIVAYYGRPGVKALGVLGQHSLENIIPIIKAKAAKYAKVSTNTNVIPGFDIIYGLAAADPGRRGDYILPLSSKILMKYIEAAKKHHFAVFIDVQLGKMTPLQAIKPLLKYLKHDNVHLAIDPEFEVHSLDLRPGKIVGHVTGTQINQVQSAMSKYMKSHGIKKKKILLVHMFRHSMVTDQHLVKGYDDIDLIMNLDGHGPARLKIDIYNNLYTKNVAAKIAGGFKLFFDEDKPKLMTPRQVLGVEAVNGVKIKSTPKFINYQ